jgi:hypothetical protein
VARQVNSLRQVFAVVVGVDGAVAQVRDEDGAERTVANDRELTAGDTVKLVLDEGGSVIRVLDT